MMLIDSAMTDCVMLEKQRESDGEGGFTTKWKEGVTFRAAITFDTSVESRIAQANGVKSLYTVTTRKNAKIDYHEVFKRLSDGKIFRATSDGDDVVSPTASRINMRQITAEEWNIV